MLCINGKRILVEGRIRMKLDFNFDGKTLLKNGGNR